MPWLQTPLLGLLVSQAAEHGGRVRCWVHLGGEDTHPPPPTHIPNTQRWESWAWWAGSGVAAVEGWAWSVRGAVRVRPWIPTLRRRLSSSHLEGAVWTGRLQRRLLVAFLPWLPEKQDLLSDLPVFVE